MKKLSVFILLFVILPVWAIDEFNIHFERLDNTGGLPSNEIRRVYQDKEGFMWFGSKNGLIRYDGYEYVVFRNSIEFPELMTHNAIMSLVDDNKYLWIGTESGLNRWNKRLRKIEKINLPEINNTEITKILITKYDYLWLATGKGIFKYFPESNSFESYLNSSSPDSPPGNNIKDAYIDSKERVWFAIWGIGLIRYNEESNSFIKYPKINENNFAHILFEDKQGNIWVGTWGSGLYKVIGEDNYIATTYQHFEEDNIPGSINSSIIYSINQDTKYGYIWIGHRNGLSILINPSDAHSFINYSSNSKNSFHNHYDVNSVYVDKSGLIWLGMFGYGIDKVNLEISRLKYNPLSEIGKLVENTTLTALWYDDRGLLWMGVKNNGLYIYNIASNKYINCSHFVNKQSLSSDVFINDIRYIKRLNEMWVSVKTGGVFRMTLGRNGMPVHSTTLSNDLQSSINVPRIYEDKHQHIWILSAFGLNVWTKQGKILRSVNFLPNSDGTLYCQSFTEDKHGNIWIGTRNQGVFCFTLANNQLKVKKYTQHQSQINNQNVISLLSDKKGRLWASTQGGGLSLFNPAKDIFESMNATYNIPYDNMFNLTEDDKHNIWMFNENAILKLDGTLSEPLQVYDVSGKQWNNSFVPYCLPTQISDYEYIIGGTRGYNILNINKMSTNTYVPPIVITDFKVNNKSIFSDQLRDRVLSENGYITLKNDENKFNIEFAALCYSNPEKNYYAYRLTGYETEWHYVDARKRFAAYTNIPKGKYKFEVKASNENGIWNETPVGLNIQIKPSVFDTFYAWLFYILIISGLAYLIFSFVKQRVRLNQRVQIVEIQKQNAEELTQTKLRFFTNISHELLTPLTIMECIVDEISKFSIVTKEQTSVMSNNITRLIYLIRQVLEFRKAESDNLKLKIAYGNVTKTINTICDINFKPLLTKKSIHFSILSNPEQIMGWFDADKIDKIIYNLISNAYKYNNENGFVQVNLKELQIAEKRHLRISIKDNGIGIAQEKIPQIFNRFYDGDYRKQNETGTGIGLSLTKILVELHKGQIRVNSKIGIGSEFIVDIPIDCKDYDAQEVEIDQQSGTLIPSDTEKQETIEISEEKRTVLLVDDNQDLLAVLTILLLPAYNVLTAENGREALEIISKQNIDLVASDVMMPEINGFELCTRIKLSMETSHILVLLLTVKSQEEDRTHGYESGADGYITKPFKPALLKSRIASLFKNNDTLVKRFKKQDVLAIKELNYTSLDEKFLAKAIKIVEEHIDHPEFDFDYFVDEIGVTRSTLYRKIKTMTGLTTSDFVKNIKLKKACGLLKKGTSNIAEVAYAVGFNDPKYFSKCFKKEFGVTPGEYLKNNQITQS